jgi:hypothetical protein
MINKEWMLDLFGKRLGAILVIFGACLSWGLSHIVFKDELQAVIIRVEKFEKSSERLNTQIENIQENVSYIRGMLDRKQKGKLEGE